MKQPLPCRLPSASIFPTLVFALLCLSCGASQAAASGPEMFTLANGMTLIVKPDHRAPTAVNMVWVRVGSMDEVDGSSGLAHMQEHMMFKGTPQVGAGEFSRRVAALGGRENAFTNKDSTAYFQQIPASRLRDVMQLEADRFANNQWSDEEFAKELEVVKEERRMRTEDNPHARLQEALDAVTFQASPYRRPIVGWMSDLQAMTAQDARSFFQRWYVPGNAAVVVAGDVEAQQVRQWAEQTYGLIPVRALPPRKPREEPPQDGLRRLDFKAPAEQAYVALAFKVPGLAASALDATRTASDAQTTDALALAVLSAVLDGYDGARLERALTQAADHVADSAGSAYGLSARGPHTFMLVGVPSQGKTALQVEQALRQQIAEIAAHGISAEELQRVKNQWVAGEVYKQDSVFNQARIAGTNWVNGLPPDADSRILEQLRKVTAAQVQSVAQRYFGDDELTVATLLPQPVDPNRKPRAAIPGARH
jgi:zinc protease